MALNQDQKRYIKKHARESTLPRLATELKLSEKEIAEYLKDQWKQDKYEKYIHKKNSNVEVKISNQGPFDIKSFLKQSWLYIVFLVVMIGVVYFNSLFGGFVSDDVPIIRDSKDIGNASIIFNDPFVFIRIFLYYIIFSFFGKNPIPYHILNVLFHTGTTLLLFTIITLSLNNSVAFIAASLFAIHPLLSEPVSWISGGTYPQHSFFILASLLTLILYLRSKNKVLYFISIFLSLLALLSADKAMTLPFLFTLYLFVFTDIRKTWKLLIPYFGLTLIWVAHYALLVKGRIANVQHEQFRKEIDFNPFQQIPVAISSYFELMVWPDKLSIYHSDFIMSTTVFVLRVSLFISYFLAMIYTFFKQRIIFFGLAFFILALMPTLSPLGISSLLAERYAYLGSAGIFFAFGYIVWRVSRNKKYETAVYLVLMILIGAFCIRTIMRNSDWQNEDTLWIATGKTAVYDPVAHMNLGDMHRRHKNYQMAEKEFKIALQLSPNNAYAHYNLGLVYTEAGAYEPALKEYKEALRIDPNLWQSYQNLSVVYDFLNDSDKSLENIQKAVALSPNNNPLLTNLGLIYLKRGEKVKAQQALSKALRLDPTDEKAKTALMNAMK